MRLRLILLIFFVWFADSSVAETLTGKVVAISDGDTLTMLQDKQQFKIRLSEIDTPEKSQPYGTKAKQALSDLVFGKVVRIEVETTDRYGRTVGKVYLEDLDINAELVRYGHAWVYRRYAKDKTLFDLETEARENQFGLWALPEEQRIAPWEWRRGKRN